MSAKATSKNNPKKKLTEAEVKRTIKAITMPKITEATYDQKSERFTVTIDNGAVISFPAIVVKEIGCASPNQLAEVAIHPSGHGLHWESLDINVSISILFRRIMNTKIWN